MEDAFPGDTFEYVGHPSSSIVIVDYDRIQVHSKKYKTDGIIVGERDGKLVSNYLAFKYNDELREEWERIFYGRFPCSDYEVSAYSQMNRKELLYPMDKGPYVAVKIGTALLEVVGGVSIDCSMRALDKNRQPVAGLFAVGDTTGGLYGHEYVTTILGNSHGRALTWGYIAAETIAADKNGAK